MKTFLLSFAAMFVLLTSKAQNFTENFNTATINSLVANCWIVTGALTTTDVNDAIAGNSLSTLPATNANTKTDVYTPILVIATSTPTVSFDYRLTNSLSGNAYRNIEVGLVTTTGGLVSSNIIFLGAGTNTNIRQYSYTFSGIIPGNYRVVFRLSGGFGNGSARIIFDNFSVSNASLYSSPTCSFTAIVESTLPVKLKNFTAMLKNSQVDLKWTTTTEINFSHFVIQRSYNGIDFSDIATVFGYGNSTDENSYQYTDKSFSSANTVVYYRLRQVDIDEKSDYSATRIIRNSKEDNNNISITTFPNPVTSEVRITIPATWQNKKVAYQLFGANGQPVKSNETTNSSQTETINVSSLAPGVYFVRVVCEGQMAQQKIIKH